MASNRLGIPKYRMSLVSEDRKMRESRYYWEGVPLRRPIGVPKRLLSLRKELTVFVCIIISSFLVGMFISIFDLL